MAGGLYEFDIADAERFAREQGIHTHKYGNELVFQYCPYCKGGKNHDRDTFAIGIDKGAFNCKRSSCAMTGNMITLARDFDFQLSDAVTRYFNMGEYKNMYKPYDYKKQEPKDGAVKYLLSRGISEKVCKDYDITIRDDGQTLIIPFRDENGEVWAVKYRNIKYVKGESKGNKEWFHVRYKVNAEGKREPDEHAKNKPILFGMYQCEDFSRLIITEGQMDSLSCTTAGLKNAVSVPTGQGGMTWIPYCYDWMNKFQEIVVFGDKEDEKITLTEMIRSRFPKKCVKVVRLEDYKDCKDANDLLRKYGKQAVIDAVENAETTVSKYIIKLSEVKYVDRDKLFKIKTGSNKLDSILDGGFYGGQLIILSGKAGNGKSTMASQFAVDAIAQGNSVFLYSGELANTMVKDWVESQIYGRPKITKMQSSECEQFYNDKFWLVDNNAVEDEEMPTVLDITEEMLIKKAVRFVIIDNLMMAITPNGKDNLYMLQSTFVGKLSRLAKRYDAVIMLVAHPRKSGNGGSNDDIAGSSDIGNKADIVMYYDKDKDRDIDDLRILRVTKNRLTGKVGNIDMWYSESRRISDIEGFFERDYLKGYHSSDGMDIPF